MPSFNLSSLQTINSLDDAVRKQLASSWARQCVQGSFIADEILGEVFVNCRVFEQLKSRYKIERRSGTGTAVVVCGRSAVGKTKSAVGLIAWTQHKFSELPYAYVVAGDNLKRSLCQLLMCREEWTEMNIVEILFAALKPYSEEELQAIEISTNVQAATEAAAGYMCGIPIPAIFSSRGLQKRQNAAAPGKTRYNPKTRNCPLPVLVIDDMVDSNNDNLIRLIYQKAALHNIFVVITTQSPELANRICGLNSKARIQPYHLGNTQWEIDVETKMANIDWAGSDNWTKEDITTLIRASIPDIGDSLLEQLEQESVTVGNTQYDLRMPVPALKYMNWLLSEGVNSDDESADDESGGIFRVRKLPVRNSSRCGG